VIAECERIGVVVEAYSPLGQGAALESTQVQEIATAHEVSAAQVVLAWHVQQGRVVIPKTTSAERMVSNADLGGLDLSAEEVQAIDALEAGHRLGNDPRTFALSQIR
jgi:diketogulonate reductase-like aldo/keto reductase